MLVIGAGHARRRGRRHRASRAGSDHSRLGSGQLGEAASRTTLQVQHVDEMLPCLHLGLTNFRELQRPTQVSPRAPTIDNGFHAQASVNILAGVLADGGGCLSVEISRCDLAQQRSRSRQFHEGSPTGTPSTHSNPPK